MIAFSVTVYAILTTVW